MKKIFAILCSATMLFAACSKEETPNEVAPIFPETQKFDALAGESYGVLFNANMAWSVSLENDYYATLTYGDKTGVEVSGEAGDDIRVFVQVKENLKNYDADIVIPVAITMGNETKTLATFTIKQIERPDAIVLNEEEIPTTITFEKGGHPSWGGEYPDAKEKYHLNYSDKWDLEGISMSCNLDGEYSIKVYTYNEGGTCTDTNGEYYNAEPWVSVSQFGQNKFKVLMELSKQSAEWAWSESQSQYESYVNFEDAEGNVLVSIFCTCTYKETSTGGGASDDSIVKMGQSPATFVSGGHPSWGGAFESAGVKYALTFADEWDCKDGVALKHSLEGVVAYKAYGYNSGFSIQEVNDSYITIDDYGDGMFVIKMDTTAPMASYSLYEGLGYEGYVNLVDASNNIVASIYCLYNPSAQGGGSTSGDVVALVDATMASAVGVTLTAISETDADYDATFGLDYGVTGAPQYRLTYSQLGALMMPNYAALNIPGFGSGQVMGQYNIGGDNWYGYQIFSVSNNPDAGGVVIEPMADNGFTAETIPNGKYPIAIYNTSYSPIARIVLELNAAQ